MPEDKLKHLEFILGVVNRVASCSFAIKGWSVVLASALFALAAKDASPVFIYLAYFPAIMFWVLDGYFLWQERLFRKLYDHVRLLQPSQIDFSMDTSTVKHEVESWPEVVFSKTLLAFHVTVILSIFAVMLLMLGR